MLESRHEDALVKHVKTVETVEIVEIVETVETDKTDETVETVESEDLKKVSPDSVTVWKQEMLAHLKRANKFGHM